MVQESVQRTSFSGPALIRLLARLNNADVSQPAQPLPERLSQWLGWSEAIALSKVLGGNVPVAASGLSEPDGAGRDYNHVRTTLREAISKVNAPAPARHRAKPAPSANRPRTDAVPDIDFSDYRRRYIALQQTMETRSTELRTRLRSILAHRSAEMAGLAAVDAVMERALSEREFSLLARIPALLEMHFKRLKQAAQRPLEDPSETDSAQVQKTGGQTQAWLDVFHEDMQSVLFAELDVRLQPAQALLAALNR